MDVDVKNAYDDVITVCGVEIINQFLIDVYRFIYYLSITNGEERFNDFCKIYVHKNVVTDSITVDEEKCFPKTLGEAIKNGKGVREILDFFTVLGKSYLFSRYDRRQVNKDKYVQYINEINDFVSKNIINTAASHKENISSPHKASDILQEKAKSINAEQKSEQDDKEEVPEKTTKELLDELYSYIGLEKVKAEVDQITKIIALRKKEEEFGDERLPLSLHLVFYGNPGTGKTTVARQLAKIYKSLGVLSKGNLVETDRSQLVGGYVGQTAIQTQKKIEEALGGILFIDEAYTLTHGKGENDFGQEAVDTILKAMEDHRDDFVVIVAGYPDLIKEFISSNPGLESRFNQYISFDDYKPEELKKIFDLLCKNMKLTYDEGCDEYLLKYFTDLYENRTDNFANGRDVRNYFENVYKVRATRLNPILASITEEEFRRITLSDLEAAKGLKKADW